MSERRSDRWLLAAVALLPAIILAVIVLIQGSDLTVAHERAAVRDARSSAITDGWVGVVVLLIVGGALAWMLNERVRGGGGPPLSSSPGDRATRAAHDRDLLVAACVELGDLISSDSLRRRIREALHSAGVDAVQAPEGAAFDPARYRVADRVSTQDPALCNRIAGTERAGYVDRGRTLREPEVLVYTLDRTDDG